MECSRFVLPFLKMSLLGMMCIQMRRVDPHSFLLLLIYMQSFLRMEYKFPPDMNRIRMRLESPHMFLQDMEYIQMRRVDQYRFLLGKMCMQSILLKGCSFPLAQVNRCSFLQMGHSVREVQGCMWSFPL